MPAQLTSLSHGAGCGCKIAAADLEPIVRSLPQPADPNLLIGSATVDDAAVYRVDGERALVQTVDFFTPIVDDPYEFGRIAAANALSDVYAMGGRPLTALNLVAFPLAQLGREVLEAILRGGHDAVSEAGAVIVGGHSIDDAEPKYGLAVTGLVHPDEAISNAGGQPGDVLVLSKPLGAGVVATAAKRGLAAAALVSAATAVMTELNADAAAAARAAGVHALTDVTGFGLVGHLHELASASGVAAEVDAQALPAIEGVLECLAEHGDAVIAGGTRRNRAGAESYVHFAAGVPEALRWLACDAMTSGGLLAAVPAEQAGAAAGTPVGRLVDGPAGEISVR